MKFLNIGFGRTQHIPRWLSVARVKIVLVYTHNLFYTRGSTGALWFRLLAVSWRRRFCCVFVCSWSADRVQAAQVETLHYWRFLYVHPTSRRLRLHRDVSANTPAAVVRRVHQGLVAHQDAAVPLRRRRRTTSQGDVRLRQRRDAVVPHPRRAQLQMQALHALAERVTGRWTRSTSGWIASTSSPAQDVQRLTGPDCALVSQCMYSMPTSPTPLLTVPAARREHVHDVTLTSVTRCRRVRRLVNGRCDARQFYPRKHILYSMPVFVSGRVRTRRDGRRSKSTTTSFTAANDWQSPSRVRRQTVK